MSETKIRRNYKDTFFRMLFKEKENLLSLYNALNGRFGITLEWSSAISSTQY